MRIHRVCLYTEVMDEIVDGHELNAVCTQSARHGHGQEEPSPQADRRSLAVQMCGEKGEVSLYCCPSHFGSFVRVSAICEKRGFLITANQTAQLGHWLNGRPHIQAPCDGT